MKNVIVIIKNVWGESPPPKVKTGFIPNLCDWEKKNYLTNPGSYYRQKASVGYIAMKGWLFTILRLPNCTFANQVFSYFPFPFSIYNPQNHPSTFSKRSVSILRFFSKTKRLF